MPLRMLVLCQRCPSYCSYICFCIICRRGFYVDLTRNTRSRSFGLIICIELNSRFIIMLFFAFLVSYTREKLKKPADKFYCS